MFGLLKRWSHLHIVIQKGKITKFSSDLPAPFVRGAQDIIESNNLAKGTIYLVEKDFGYTLEYSSHIPENLHQTFRNIWNLNKGKFQK